jgi:hypothetical protein
VSLSPVRRLLSFGRPSYKRVSSAPATERHGARRISDESPSNRPDADAEEDDLYATDDEVAHGKFVYCAFLMLGNPIMMRVF